MLLKHVSVKHKNPYKIVLKNNGQKLWLAVNEKNIWLK